MQGMQGAKRVGAGGASSKILGESDAGNARKRLRGCLEELGQGQGKQCDGDKENQRPVAETRSGDDSQKRTPTDGYREESTAVRKVLVHELPASTIILSGKSAFFRTMFASRFKEASFKAGIRQVDICLYQEGMYTSRGTGGNTARTCRHARCHFMDIALFLLSYSYLREKTCC